MAEKVQIDTSGIKKVLKNYQPEQAIAEYIWNGFDAGASEVRVSFEDAGGLGALASITIADNGSGIERKSLDSKFKPFLHSEKQSDDLDRSRSLNHGKNGYGRLTFFSFAQKAVWSTSYLEDTRLKQYDITVESNTLEDYQVVGEVKDVQKHTGTSVLFTGIFEITKDFLLLTAKDYLRIEFCWFLELYKDKGFKIYIDGKELEYDEIVGDRDTKTIKHQTGTEFNVSFVRWNKALKNEYSRFYLVDQYGDEKWKGTTRLNNKGDEFYHSVYITSPYFDTFVYDANQSEDQTTMLGHSRSDDAYKYLEEEVTKYLRNKRRPFLEVYVNQKIEEFKKGGILPQPKTDWDIPKSVELENVVKGLYVIQPKIFTSASDDQKKIFVRLLNSLLDTAERESILRIIDEVMGLDETDKQDLLDLLKVTSMSGIVRTSKMIEERFSLAESLKEVVFNKDFKANERDHLQKLLDKHFWIFGEEYTLVTTTDVKFEKAISQYIYLLRGKKQKVKSDHPDKNKEMDLFLSRQSTYTDTIENLIVEIKSPSVNLGMKEVSQLKEYKSVIFSLPECNAPNMHWNFILIGNRFDTSGFIEGEVESAKTHGEKHKGLIHSVENCKMYVKTWASVFTDFECRHNFLQDRLNLEKDAVSKQYPDLKTLMSDALGNKAGAKAETSD